MLKSVIQRKRTFNTQQEEQDLIINISKGTAATKAPSLAKAQAVME
jgi:hypothetical protein